MGDEVESYARLANLGLIEELYQKYCSDPSSVDSSWRYFFEGMEFSRPVSGRGEGGDELKVYRLIEAYRMHGHLFCRSNPLEEQPPKEPDELKIETWGFTKEDLSRPMPTCGFLQEDMAPLQTLIDALRRVYCDKVGIEYLGLESPSMEKWIQKKIEPQFPKVTSKDEKLFILQYLNKAELFETFIHTKYVGQKRFSIEGGETLIPILASLIEQGADLDLEEVILGMAHRGRLNVLANIMNKSYGHIFHEFEDHYTPDLSEGTGDVKYHKGFHGSLTAKSGKQIEVSLAANPSHLESVNPLVEGQTRAKQELKGDGGEKKIIPVLVHGDASIAGQGVVYETLQMCRLEGYKTAGTIHIVVNNQIGYTALPNESRSTRYCTDIAVGFGCPVFHVNAEDPEGCVSVAKLAVEIRQIFGCDVFIDLLCYRKYGHNESDEPTFTQPKLYKLIRQKKTIRELYKNQLVQEGVISEQEAQQMEEQFKASLHKSLELLASLKEETKDKPVYVPKEYEKIEASIPSLSKQDLQSLAEAICKVPSSFQIHPKIQRLLTDRLSMVNKDPSEKTIDYGMGEHLAFASLLKEGIHIRLSGQDSQRGTFSHRHCVWVDQNTSSHYTPLSTLSKVNNGFVAYNSLLSEFAVLGFELGYSMSYPHSLVFWEAQFGDFANGAQVIIDQYLASAQQKWSLRSNLVLLLPHGYEGQGPEHSSARIERYLQLAADCSMTIANVTTPAQLFHLLRKQAYLTHKRPLVLFTPKALLRHPLCVSSLQEFTDKGFEGVLEDGVPISNASKVILCSGKVYYDLIQEREKRGNKEIAILRLEQLYPFPAQILQDKLKQVRCKEVLWVQEEHKNMGAWDFVCPLLLELLAPLGKTVRYCGRNRSSSPAAGSYALHKKQYEAMMDEAFNL